MAIAGSSSGICFHYANYAAQLRSTDESSCREEAGDLVLEVGREMGAAEDFQAWEEATSMLETAESKSVSMTRWSILPLDSNFRFFGRAGAALTAEENPRELVLTSWLGSERMGLGCVGLRLASEPKPRPQGVPATARRAAKGD